MIKVGFILFDSKGWMGGVNYMKNLLFALQSAEEIQPMLLVGKKADEKFVKEFEKFGTIVRTSLFDKYSLAWFVHNVSRRIFLKSFLFDKFIEKNLIDVISHSGTITKSKSYKTINWIPDFQHRRLPGMFSVAEVKYRDMAFLKMIKESDRIVLSSNDALQDLDHFFPGHLDKARVLQFVSQPNEKIYEISDAKQVEEKYRFMGKFFYLPNQLWKHKNHVIVLKAVAKLKEEGKEVLVLCSGHTGDYRNKGHFEELKKYIQDNKLENNVKFLGLIDYIDVLTLMRHCISIVNPSLFEGWSSTVEEAKSVGKNMILSNLKVHIEQDPPLSVYFDPYDEKDLAEKMWKKWQESEGGPDFELEEYARKNIKRRTKEFGKKYQDTVLKIVR